ncbi:hypothetical protein Rs2_27549 [Raphanus sativus]|uniref:Uncharacterized protein LOC108807116 n=1 Tax=Raphanus sativus TaxID=3726 RepID=A0A6J0JGW4_RAPSA|nr:uncharacterized protein LOC108807116 [Raphanus sativus]KAJ4887801.1 hypothetical protein Rs2_27549 [Raphanus sativus]
MSPGQSKLPSDSIKVVPGRSKLRVESSNPVARGNPVPRPSKVKPIAPEEAIKLHSGVSQVRFPPPPSESSRPYKYSRPSFESRLKPVPATFGSQRRQPSRATFESSRREPVRPPFESSRPKPVPATFESQRPKPARATFEAPRNVPARPNFKPPRPVPPRQTSKPPEPVPARPAPCLRKEIVCGLRAASSMDTTTVRKRSNPRSLHQPREVELPPSPSALQIPSRVELPPSPSSLQIPSRVQRRATTDAMTHTIEETVVEVSDKAKDHGSKETCRSTSEERISELLLYRPALLPTWKGRIVDSATLFPEFDCQFRANPSSYISRKALRLSMAMPIFLEVEVVPTGHILNNVFGRIPRLSDVQLYFFSDDKETERSKREHAHLFEAMATRKAMIKASVNGTELLIFSSKLLDKTSQFFIKKQTKTENYLWGFFLHNKNLRAHVPGTCNQDDSSVVDMDIDPQDQPIAESQITPSSLLGKIWTPPSSRPYGSSGERPSCS